jgi:hypothetical protein
MDPRKLEVGDIVEVGRFSYHGAMLFAGVAEVVRKNKVRIVLKSKDGHIFNFSARLGELIIGGGKVSYDMFVRPVGFFNGAKLGEVRKSEV